MTSRTSIAALAALGVLAVAGCGDGGAGDDTAGDAPTSPPPSTTPSASGPTEPGPADEAPTVGGPSYGTTPPAVSIAVEQVAGGQTGTVWSLDGRMDAERSGAEAAFQAASLPFVRRQAESPRRVESARGSENAYRLTIVYEDDERVVVEAGESGLTGPLLDVVRAVQKSAEPVRG